MLKTKSVKVVEVSDWDELVTKTYSRVYRLQQQDGCMNKGTINFKVPLSEEEVKEWDNEMNDLIPLKINGSEMGVKFEVWLKADPNKPVQEEVLSYRTRLFWERNFYPNFYVIANDLHSRGLIEDGEYSINIDW